MSKFPLHFLVSWGGNKRPRYVLHCVTPSAADGNNSGPISPSAIALSVQLRKLDAAGGERRETSEATRLLLRPCRVLRHLKVLKERPTKAAKGGIEGRREEGIWDMLLLLLQD